MKKSRNSLIAGIIGWTSAILMFFPIFWMVVTSFKSEIDAVVPSILFEPTLQSYADVNSRANYLHYALNSVVESIGSTILALLIGLPAAYACAFYPGKRTKNLLLWMLSTKMMPAVGVLVPMYLLFRDAGLLDTRIGLVILFTLSNLPIVIWMLYSFFKDVPTPILEAGRMDGARFWTQMRYILIPISLPGIASTALLSIILCWNESILVAQSFGLSIRASDGLHRVLLKSGGAVLGQAVGSIDACSCANPRHGVDHAAPTGARSDLRSREIIELLNSRN